MRKARAISYLLLAAAAGAFTLYLTLIRPPAPEYDREVLNIPLGDDARVVAYRDNRGGATVPFTYHAFVLGSGEKPEDKTPFLITSSHDILVDIRGENDIEVRVTGTVYDFTNRIWVRGEGGLHRVMVDFRASPDPEGSGS